MALLLLLFYVLGEIYENNVFCEVIRGFHRFMSFPF